MYGEGSGEIFEGMTTLGAAWFDKEHDELGIPFPATGERFDLLEDALEIVTRLFTGETVSYEWRVVSLRDARLNPVPVQSPHPPIWIGGTGPRRTLPYAAARGTLRRRVARVGLAELVARGERPHRPTRDRSRP